MSVCACERDSEVKKKSLLAAFDLAFFVGGRGGGFIATHSVSGRARQCRQALCVHVVFVQGSQLVFNNL